MELKRVYDDSLKSLENTCRSRLLDILFEQKKQKDVEKAVKANGGKPLNYFMLPSMLRGSAIPKGAERPPQVTSVTRKRQMAKSSSERPPLQNKFQSKNFGISVQKLD